jgi:hypothetical protein
VKIDLHLPEAAGWRGLLTQAQQTVGCLLPERVEEYVVRLLYRTLGHAAEPQFLRAEAFAHRIFDAGAMQVGDLAALGDHSLLLAGLFPDHAIRQRIPLSYCVSMGRYAYREHAASRPEGARLLYQALCDRFVTMLDVLLSIRECNDGAPCLDGLSAFQLWSEAGSSRGWHALRQMTSALPAGATSQKH